MCVELPRGHRIFRSNVVKPYQSDKYASPESEVNSARQDDFVTPELFEDSRFEELLGMIDQCVFDIVDRTSVPKGLVIYGTRWVDNVKNNSDGSLRLKSRIFGQNYSDKAAGKHPTKAPTISRMGPRLICVMSTLNLEQLL